MIAIPIVDGVVLLFARLAELGASPAAQDVVRQFLAEHVGIPQAILDKAIEEAKVAEPVDPKWKQEDSL